MTYKAGLITTLQCQTLKCISLKALIIGLTEKTIFKKKKRELHRSSHTWTALVSLALLFLFVCGVNQYTCKADSISPVVHRQQTKSLVRYTEGYCSYTHTESHTHDS